MANNNSFSPVPPGPGEKIDIHIDQASFPKLEQLLQNYTDICRISPESRSTDTFLLNHPDYLKRVLVENHKNYIKGPGFERVKLLLGNGIIVSDGELWKQQRRMVQPAFHRDMLNRLTGMMQAASAELLAQWEACAEEKQAINLNETMSRFALEVVLRGIFGDDLDWLIEIHGENPFTIFSEDSSRDLNLAVKFRALIKLMMAVIERRRGLNEPRQDMLGALMLAKDLDGQPMPDKALIDEIMTLIVAGHETSATTLTWMWYLLSQHPDSEACLHREVDEFSGQLNFEQLSGLGYCKQVMYEALRLYPPVWLFSRKALEDDKVGEYNIPAGSDIFISPYFLHRRADLWPKPEDFDPGRFAEANAKDRHRTAYIPFSAGPRRCIGDVFATVEIQIHMSTIARRIALKTVDEPRIELEAAINLRNKHPIMMMPVIR